MAAEPATATPGFVREVRLGTLLWIAGGALFIALRIAGLLSIPVGGVELHSISGAWQASNGVQDDRFVPTLFQAITALLFQGVDNEIWPRLLAVAAASTVPFALYRLREAFTEPGALLALALLTFDAPGVLFTSTASFSALDIPLVLWLLVFLRQPEHGPMLIAVLGFLLATAGPLVLPAVLAIAVVRLARQDYPETRSLAYAGGGAVAGIFAASVQFGLGWDGLRIPPLEAFAAGFDSSWSTEPAIGLVYIYLLPILLVAVAAAGWGVWRMTRGYGTEHLPGIVGLGLALLWVLSSAQESNPLPLAGLSLMAAVVIGQIAPIVVTTVLRADWTWARYLVPAAIGALLISLAFLMEWARDRRVGEINEQVAFWGMLIVGLGAAVLAMSQPRARPTGLVILLPFLLAAHLTGVFAVAFGGPNEPMPSPISPVQAREVRNIALTARAEFGGDIVVHPRYEHTITWAFRDSGTIIIASQVPLTAVALVWPPDAPAPDGFSIVDGEWALLRERSGPEGGQLDYLRWYFNRNTLGVGSVPVHVYLRGGE
jgi:hypothetical protein